jgi:hypothetical protein
MTGLALLAVPAHAQKSEPVIPLNSAAAFVEFSNASSHIVLGESRQRLFAGLALAYQRRLSNSHGMSWTYSAEVRPFLFESDPTLREAHIKTVFEGRTHEYDQVLHHQLPILNPGQLRNISISGTTPDGEPFLFQANFRRGRRWTYAPGITPACFSVHLLPQYRLQPFLASTGGFIVSPRDLPVFDSSAFNFTFSFGGGLEWFRERRRSWIVEYRVQHMSNKKIGTLNPGVDSQFIRIGYRFGF